MNILLNDDKVVIDSNKNICNTCNCSTSTTFVSCSFTSNGYAAFSYDAQFLVYTVEKICDWIGGCHPTEPIRIRSASVVYIGEDSNFIYFTSMGSSSVSYYNPSNQCNQNTIGSFISSSLEPPTIIKYGKQYYGWFFLEYVDEFPMTDGYLNQNNSDGGGLFAYNTWLEDENYQFVVFGQLTKINNKCTCLSLINTCSFCGTYTPKYIPVRVQNLNYSINSNLPTNESIDFMCNYVSNCTWSGVTSTYYSCSWNGLSNTCNIYMSENLNAILEISNNINGTLYTSSLTFPQCWYYSDLSCSFSSSYIDGDINDTIQFGTASVYSCNFPQCNQIITLSQSFIDVLCNNQSVTFEFAGITACTDVSSVNGNRCSRYDFSGNHNPNISITFDIDDLMVDNNSELPAREFLCSNGTQYGNHYMGGIVIDTGITLKIDNYSEPDCITYIDSDYIPLIFSIYMDGTYINGKWSGMFDYFLNEGNIFLGYSYSTVPCYNCGVMNIGCPMVNKFDTTPNCYCSGRGVFGGVCVINIA